MQIYSPGTYIGSYEIASHPMQGGMGVVYFCLDHNNDHPVALKTFKPEFLPDRAARDRFLREGTAWVELGRHPHIVRCYEVKYEDPTAYLVLELIAKEQGMADASLRSWVGQPMPLRQALLFALQIARGMGYANAKIPGFVHRDLKPENVLVGIDKLPGTDINRLRVTDFGLATILAGGRDAPGEASPSPQANPRSTQLTHGLAGTPLYMAPEQWQGQPVGVYTDIYALGCILSEMLTGRFAARGRSIGELQIAHCKGRLRPLPSDVPRMVQDLVARSLALRPVDRYPDWVEMTRALEVTYAALGYGPVPQGESAQIESLEERRLASGSYNVIGVAYNDLGNPKLAISYFKKAIQLAAEAGDRRGEGYAMINLGSAYAILGDILQAIGSFEQGLMIDREIGDRRGEGAALGNLGLSYMAMSDVHRAIEYFEQDLVIDREIGDRLGEGTDLGNLGIAYMKLGDVRRAIKYYEQSLIIAREFSDRRGEDKILGDLGLAYARLGDTHRAIGYYEQALVIDREIGDRHGEGADLSNLGSAYLDLGDARQAIRCYEQGLEIAREIGDRGGESVALGNLGNAFVDLNDARRAIGYFEQCLIIMREIGDRLGEGAALGNLGTAYANLGDLHRAIRYSEQYLAIAREITDRRAEGTALSNLGSEYLSLGDVQQAIGYLERCLELYREIGDRQGEANGSWNLGIAYERVGKIDKAITALQVCVDFEQSIGHPRAKESMAKIDRLKGGRASYPNPALQAAFEAFKYASSFNAMQVAVVQNPIMKSTQFIQSLETWISEYVQPVSKSVFEQRLTWLKQIAKF